MNMKTITDKKLSKCMINPPDRNSTRRGCNMQGVGIFLKNLYKGVNINGSG